MKCEDYERLTAKADSTEGGGLDLSAARIAVALHEMQCRTCQDRLHADAMAYALSTPQPKLVWDFDLSEARIRAQRERHQALMTPQGWRRREQ